MAMNPIWLSLFVALAPVRGEHGSPSMPAAREPVLSGAGAVGPLALQEPEKPAGASESKQDAGAPESKGSAGAEAKPEPAKKEEKKDDEKKKDKKGDKDKKEERRKLQLSAPKGDALFVHAQRVIVRPGEELADADVLVQFGRIAAVGKGLAAPEGAQRLEAEVVCAGFIDPWASIGLDAESVQDAETTADTQAMDALDPFTDAYLRVEALRSGVVAARVQVGRLAALAGIGSLLRLVPSKDPQANALAPEACVGASLGLGRGGPTDPFDRLSEVERLATAIDGGRRLVEARAEYAHDLEEWKKTIADKEKELEKDFKKAKKDREKEQKDAQEKGKEFKDKSYKEDKRPSPPNASPEDEVMARVANGELPLVVEVHRATEIKALLEATAEFDRLRLVLAGATEALPLASRIAERGIPVIVWPMPLGSERPPHFAMHDLSLAGKLAEAGVTVLIGSGGVGESGSATRDLAQFAGLAVGHGLDRQTALASVTTAVARVFDVADRMGSVEVGKQADLLLLQGDPLSPGARVQYVISAGAIVLDPSTR